MKRVLLVVALSVLSWCTQRAWAQGGDAAITGVVLSATTKQPIPGASVTIPGVSTAITDDEGKFALKRTTKGAVVRVRASGFANKEVVVGTKKELSILLHDESFNTIYRSIYSPYGRKDWQAATGSATSILNKNNYMKAATSPESLIQDEGLGVNTVTRSGAPGAGSNMFLWGFSSINASTQPMILIDGVPYENAMVTPSLISGNNITPLGGYEVKDIESITIMKDATSLYGSKGGNGVIMIETAKAQEQATKIDFYAYAGVNFAPSNQYQMMDASGYRSYLHEMVSGSGLYTVEQIEKLPYFDQTKPVVEKWGIEGNKDYYRYNQQTDWQKEIFQNSLSQNYYISIKGGDEIALYALSVGYMDHEGTIKTTDFSRYSTQFNSQINVMPRLKMFANMSVAYNDRKMAYEGLASNFNPIYTSLVKAPFMAPHRYNELGIQMPIYENADVFGVSNPVALTDEDNMRVFNKSYRFFGNIGATFDLGKGFDLSAIFGVTFDKSRETIFLPQLGVAHNPLTAGVVTNESKALAARFFQYYGDFRLGYKRTFDRVHKVSAMLGARYQTNDTEADWIQAFNSSSDDMRSVGNGDINLTQISGVLGNWKWLSFYLNGEYSYLNRYFLSYNMAMDASSRFGTEANGIKMGSYVYGIFPSVTASWLVSSEDFMSEVSFIDVLRLRAGYSIAGNDDIGNYTARTSYTSQNLFGFYGLVRSNIVNPRLKWETNAKASVGLDVAMFNERLRFNVDVFQTKITDLLTWQHGDSYDGISTYASNDGAMQNRGIELGVQARIINAAIKWDLGVNIATYRNKVTALPQDETITEIAGGYVLTKVGSPLGQFYGYKTDGVYATSADAVNTGLNIQRGDGALIPFHAGDVRFVNSNSDNIINEQDMVVIGDPNPDFYGSIVSRLQWKRLALNMVWTYSYGNDVYNAMRASVESMTGAANQTTATLNRWSKEGHVTSMPRAQWGDPMGNARFSDRWIEDGSYIRLKSLSLSYDIPLSINFIKGLQVYVTGNNLLTFTKYLGYDPEFSAQQNPLYYGIDMGITPMPQSLLFGVKLGL